LRIAPQAKQFFSFVGTESGFANIATYIDRCEYGVSSRMQTGS
jgi:hypothetical protein